MHNIRLTEDGWGRGLPYSGNLLREKSFANFPVLWLFAKGFSAKFWGMASIGVAKASNPQKFSLRKSYFSPISNSFLCESCSFHQLAKVFSLETFLLILFCIP